MAEQDKTPVQCTSAQKNTGYKHEPTKRGFLCNCLSEPLPPPGDDDMPNGGFHDSPRWWFIQHFVHNNSPKQHRHSANTTFVDPGLLRIADRSECKNDIDVVFKASESTPLPPGRLSIGVGRKLYLESTQYNHWVPPIIFYDIISPAKAAGILGCHLKNMKEFKLLHLHILLSRCRSWLTSAAKIFNMRCRYD